VLRRTATAWRKYPTFAPCNCNCSARSTLFLAAVYHGMLQEHALRKKTIPLSSCKGKPSTIVRRRHKMSRKPPSHSFIGLTQIYPEIRGFGYSSPRLFQIGTRLVWKLVADFPPRLRVGDDSNERQSHMFHCSFCSGLVGQCFHSGRKAAVLPGACAQFEGIVVVVTRFHRLPSRCGCMRSWNKTTYGRRYRRRRRHRNNALFEIRKHRDIMLPSSTLLDSVKEHLG